MGFHYVSIGFLDIHMCIRVFRCNFCVSAVFRAESCPDLRRSASVGSRLAREAPSDSPTAHTSLVSRDLYTRELRIQSGNWANFRVFRNMRDPTHVILIQQWLPQLPASLNDRRHARVMPLVLFGQWKYVIDDNPTNISIAYLADLIARTVFFCAASPVTVQLSNCCLGKDTILEFGAAPQLDRSRSGMIVSP